MKTISAFKVDCANIICAAAVKLTESACRKCDSLDSVDRRYTHGEESSGANEAQLRESRYHYIGG